MDESTPRPELVDKAAAALLRDQSMGLCTLGEVCGMCDCFAWQDGGKMRDARVRDTARLVLETVADDLRAEAWDACVDEATDLGWLHSPAAVDVAGRNPYKKTETESE